MHALSVNFVHNLLCYSLGHFMQKLLQGQESFQELLVMQRVQSIWATVRKFLVLSTNTYDQWVFGKLHEDIKVYILKSINKQWGLLVSFNGQKHTHVVTNRVTGFRKLFWNSSFTSVMVLFRLFSLYLLVSKGCTACLWIKKK